MCSSFVKNEQGKGALLTSFAKKYRKEFVRAVGDAVWISPEPESTSLAEPLWKSKSTMSTWKHMPTRVDLGSSPLKTR